MYLDFKDKVCSSNSRVWVQELRPLIKRLGGKIVSTINNKVDIFIYDSNLMYADSSYRSGLYQSRHNKAVMLGSNDFCEWLKEQKIDIPECLIPSGIRDISTREKKLENFVAVVDENCKCMRYAASDFNDDIYEENFCGYYDFYVEDDFRQVLIDTGVKEEVIDTLNGEKIRGEDILKACEWRWCFREVVALLLATRWFMDDNCEANFRIYRDKWEYRGDYYGMYEHEWQVPPPIYWEIGKNHPYGYSSAMREP